MRLRGYSRFPWLDLWIVPTLVLIGWATFRLSEVEPEISKSENYFRQIENVFTQCQKWVREGVDDLESKRRESDRRWQEAMTLRGELMTISETLEASVPELERALNEADSRKEAANTLQQVQKSRAWIAKEKDRVNVERLDAKSKQFNQWLEGCQISGTNGPLRLNRDLGALITAIDGSYEQYLSDFQSLADNIGKPLVGASIAGHRASARQAAGQLVELAQEARQDVQAIQVVMESAPRSEVSEASRRQQEVVQAFKEARSPAEFVGRMDAGDGNSAAGGDHSRTSLVRRVRYGLIATLAALAAFLIIDVYRRTIVSPLRLKLVEREGQIEHQKKLAHFEELAAGLAHEIRNPLTAISARLYTIQRKLREGTAEYQDGVVIGSEIDRANQILKEFIQVTRPAPPRLELITAGLLLEDVSHLMSPQLERKSVKLEVQLPARTRFYGDQQQLKQVLVNLVQNAAESMDSGGEVILRAREGRVPVKGALTRAAIIEVEDNGPGIRPEIQERLFEPFFSTKKEGTGLGLPISARIIDRHGGTLDFETQPQHGTIFRIVLPSHEG